jgi:release factor glutamine methyltransferase
VSLPTVGALLAASTAHLERYGVPSPRVDAEHLLAHALGLTRLDLYLQFDRPLEPAEVDALRELVRRRARREPLAYVLGAWGFRGLDLACDARALVPRPETEQLVELALAAIAEQAAPCVLDVGTGGGAIALAIAAERPDAVVVAVDSSPDALALAAANAERTGLRGRVELRAGDLLEPVAGARFALVVSNPPYVAEGAQVDPEVERFEPAAAVYGGPRGDEVVVRLVDGAPDVLAAGGTLALELGAGQAPAVAARLAAAGYHGSRVERDLAGVERFAIAQAPD